VNLRERVVRDNKKFLEGVWGLPVELTGPAGAKQSDLRGQVIYHSFTEDPDTGARVISDMICVSLHRLSLTRIPVAGERWQVRVPSFPNESAPLIDYLVTDLAPQDGQSIGFIRLYGTLIKDVSP